ncbi:MAG: uroporphyrinogen decarboxylase family protein [Prevotella sp.]|nr:uroporphyrinogen decarboxylase family protein [Prevotella sp.]MBR2291436.1 uroporphyrinogen decarboxylase family protein [Prevotella sp.]
MKRWVADVIRQREVTALPVMTHPGIEMNGHTVREAVSNGRVHYEAVMTLTRRYPAVAAATIMDLTTEAEAFGAEIAFSDEAVPAVSSRLLPDVKSINRLQVPSLSTGRIPQYLKANLLAAKEITDRPLFAGCIGPFSLAGRLYDMSEIMMLIYENPDAAHTLLAKCTQFIEKYCQALKRTGANGVMMAEPAAGLMSNDDCQNFSSAYVRYIVNKVQDENFIVILHNCGNTGQCTQAMVATGAAAYHFGNKCKMEEVIKDVPPTALAMGNIDPVSIFKDGMPFQMRQTVTDLLEKMRPYPNFVLSSGCDTPPHTPLANVDAFFESLADFNRQ